MLFWLCLLLIPIVALFDLSGKYSERAPRVSGALLCLFLARGRIRKYPRISKS